MKTNLKINKYRYKRQYIKYYAGLYPLGAYISWPKQHSVTDTGDEISYKRAKAGGYIALPTGKQ